MSKGIKTKEIVCLLPTEGLVDSKRQPVSPQRVARRLRAMGEENGIRVRCITSLTSLSRETQMALKDRETRAYFLADGKFKTHRTKDGTVTKTASEIAISLKDKGLRVAIFTPDNASNTPKGIQRFYVRELPVCLANPHIVR